ncbi:hypothetical protein [Nevskia sp.]|uniref:hypothetical protein n=1 Tax=Nevskia sp. TaxID=1929292 RepID=UPI0025EAC8F1|nr:hypothetical protein [Nevskia sp.]
MLGAFVAADIYRVMLGSNQADSLSRALETYRLPTEHSLRQMRRDDGSGVWVAVVLIDGETLERISLLQALSLMQIDNISARLRAAPTLPGSPASLSLAASHLRV